MPSLITSGPVDPEGLSTVEEVPRGKTSDEPDYPIENHHELPTSRPSSSHGPSMDYSFAQSYSENAEPPPVPYTSAPRKAQHARRVSEGKLRKSDRRTTIAINGDPDFAAKQRRGGLRNTIRRMFGRKPAKGRTSMPTGTGYEHQDPQEFITATTGVNSPRKVERSASLPTSAYIRSSGLSSHPPYEPPAMPPAVGYSSHPHSSQDITEQSPRPRRSSVPSASFTKDDLQAVTEAMSGIGPRFSSAQGVDAQNIGFAVTNGSNPRRRSRSVGAFRESNHRMSPIQWRHFRTKSDDFIYHRESKDIDVGSETNQDAASPDDNNEPDAVSQEGDFNFGLQDGLQGQERIGLEERLVTLEIKLMDLEYSLSRLQAGPVPASQPPSHRGHGRQESVETNGVSDHTSTPAETSPGLTQEVDRFSVSRPFATDVGRSSAIRPTSVATTLKPGQNPQSNSFSRPAATTEKRSSLTSGLTIEHYTTLVTLLRHEQSARMRLEEQVSQLQQKIDSSQALKEENTGLGGSRSAHYRDLSSSSGLSRRFGTIDDPERRKGQYYMQSRPRASSYSTNETDTEDDYHDVYATPTAATPVERGEYERGAFNRIPGVEDGEAF